MAVILPMLLKTKLDTTKKVTLCMLVSSVFFVMICAIVRAYYSIHSIDDLTVALGWASREIFAASIVVSAPGLKPLFSSIRSKFFGYQGSGNRSKSEGIYGRGNVATITGGVGGSAMDKPGFELSSATAYHTQPRSMHRTESQERIIGITGGTEVSVDRDHDSEIGKEGENRVRTEWTVE